MIALGTAALLRPWWLTAVPAVILLAYLYAPASSGLAGWDEAVARNLLLGLNRLGAVIPGTGRNRRESLLCALIIALALAGPALEREDRSTFRNLDGLVIVFDVSRSMEVGGRMPEARNAARAIIDAAGSRQVALIVYAGDAYLVTPFATDNEELSTTILALDGRTVPDPGSRPTRALTLARRTLAEANIARGDVILISDGGGVDGATLREGEALAGAGYSLTTLFVPAKQPLPDSAPVPDRTLLDSLAMSGHGLARDVIVPEPVVAQIEARPAVRLGQTDYAVLAWRDYGRLLVAAALLPALLLFRRRL